MLRVFYITESFYVDAFWIDWKNDDNNSFYSLRRYNGSTNIKHAFEKLKIYCQKGRPITLVTDLMLGDDTFVTGEYYDYEFELVEFPDA